MKYIYKTSVENHDEIKKLLLEQIDLIPNNPFNVDGCKLFHTDWNLPVEMHREYKFLFFKTVNEHLKKIALDLEVPNVEFTSFWFQQYKENSLHGWHTHGGANFANVYFLECPEGASTEFKNFQIDCKEGDIISFPAFLPHRSPIINKEYKKTVIAFNTNFTFRNV